MTEELIRHQCTICKAEFFSKDMAAACEAVGVPADYPIGTMFRDQTKDQSDTVWAVAKNMVGWNSHHNVFEVWCVRTTRQAEVLPGRGPNCAHYGNNELGRLNHWDALTEPDDPALHRMVAMLNAVGIAPHVWNGTQAVPYLEWVASFQRREAP